MLNLEIFRCGLTEVERLVEQDRKEDALEELRMLDSALPTWSDCCHFCHDEFPDWTSLLRHQEICQSIPRNRPKKYKYTDAWEVQ